MATMKNTRSRLLTFLIALLVLCYACYLYTSYDLDSISVAIKVGPRAVEAGNAQRSILGLREIKPPAVFDWTHFSEEKWYAGRANTKGVLYRRGEPNVWYEFAEYRTGVIYNGEEGEYSESLIIWYDYELKRYYFAYSGENPKYRNKFDDLVYEEPVIGLHYYHFAQIHNETHGIDNFDTFTNVVDPVFKDLGLNRLEYRPAPTSAVINAFRWQTDEECCQ